MAHGFANVGYRWDPRPRGDESAFLTQMLMVSARRRAGTGWLDGTVRVSAEPLVGTRGYPLLLQTGETSDGVYPLVDRQHPHDALGELSITYSIEIEDGAWAFLHAAPVGSPALGPQPFMHRRSSGASPSTPITHHFLDATHVAHGVLTGGIHNGLMQVEASWFNGHEPDQRRWLPEAPSLNSWSARITVTPGSRWVVQASHASLDQPEQVHPVVDVDRSTLSLTHEVPVGDGAWSTTLAWGRNSRHRTIMTLGEARARLPAPLLAHYLGLTPPPPDADDAWLLLIDEAVRSGILVESALRWGDLTASVRYERASKDELIAAPDPRHSTAYRIAKAEVGMLYDVGRMGVLSVAAGATASTHWIAPELEEVYGSARRSYTVFARVGL
jgi:hypothetical protein